MTQQTVESESKQTTRGRNDALNIFGKFTKQKYNKKADAIIKAIGSKELDVYAVLRDFAKFLTARGTAGSSAKTYLTHVRKHIVEITDIDIIQDKMDIKVKPHMPTVHWNRDAELTSSTVARIISAMPERMKLLCLLEVCTLRRPHEINHLRVCDIDFTKDPTEIRIPSSISKNNAEGRTFCTAECTKMLTQHIKKYDLSGKDRLFTYTNTQTISSLFIQNLHRQLPDMRKKMDNGRYEIHLYSLKKYGYSIVKYNISKEFANDLKGDKEEYDRLQQKQRIKLYKRVEPLLSVFNQDLLQNELESIGEDTGETKAVLSVLVQALKTLNNPEVNRLLQTKIGNVVKSEDESDK